jgi:pyruvate/2-oxoglutarate dehydrogenase complex dihydrolipoamide acyltransferase (E2) component
MREKLNGNPVAQVVLIGVLLVVVGFLFLSQMGGGGSSSSTAGSTTPTTAASTATTPATPADATAAPTATTAPTAAPSSVSASGLSLPPLPAPVTSAYEAGKTVVLLIVRNGGIDDRMVAADVHRLAPVAGLAVFVVPVRQVARYAAITLGVQVDRTPALIVMRPRHLSGGTPQASVSYGFQSPQTVVQAVLDASYNGPSSTYHPN